MHRATGAILGALAPAIPSNALGDHCSPSHHYISGWDPKGEQRYIMYPGMIGVTPQDLQVGRLLREGGVDSVQASPTSKKLTVGAVFSWL